MSRRDHFNSRFPYYNDDSDYTTNAPSYYDDLARKSKIVQELAQRIWEYDKLLAEKFAEWDKNMEELPLYVQEILEKWLADGTLADIINNTIFGDLNDKIDGVDKRVDKTNADLKQLGIDLTDLINDVNQALNAKIDDMENSIPKLIDADIQYTVGALGDFQTLTAALESISKRHMPYKQRGFKAEILLLSDYVMKEQVIVKGADLGWVTISSDKVARTIINRDSMTINTIESRYPAFTGLDNAVLPNINVLFEFNLGNKKEGFDGVTVARGSKVQLMPGSGVYKADRGLGAYYNSEAFCYMEGLTEGGNGIGAGVTTGVEFKKATNRAFMATYGSTIHCARAQLQDCEGDHAVYAIWGSNVDVYQSNISGSAGTGIMSRDGSRTNARETNVSGCNIGYHASHGGEINARSLKESKWIGDSAQFCKQYGALASYASRIELDNVDVSHSLRHGVHASDGSIINGANVYANEVADQAFSAFRSATINADNAQAIRAGKAGVLADSNSHINANNIITPSCIDHAIVARNGSTISAENADVHHSNKGFYAYNGSTITAKNSNAERCNEGYIARFASTIDAEGADASNCQFRGFASMEASTINAVNSTADNIVSMKTGNMIDQSIAFLALRASFLNCRGSKAINCNYTVVSYEGSNVNATSTDFRNSLQKSYQVYRGSTIVAVAPQGEISQTENELTQHGVIYSYKPD